MPLFVRNSVSVPNRPPNRSLQSPAQRQQYTQLDKASQEIPEGNDENTNKKNNDNFFQQSTSSSSIPLMNHNNQFHPMTTTSDTAHNIQTRLVSHRKTLSSTNEHQQDVLHPVKMEDNSNSIVVVTEFDQNSNVNSSSSLRTIDINRNKLPNITISSTGNVTPSTSNLMNPLNEDRTNTMTKKHTKTKSAIPKLSNTIYTNVYIESNSSLEPVKSNAKKVVNDTQLNPGRIYHHTILPEQDEQEVEQKQYPLYDSQMSRSQSIPSYLEAPGSGDLSKGDYYDGDLTPTGSPSLGSSYVNFANYFYPKNISTPNTIDDNNDVVLNEELQSNSSENDRPRGPTPQSSGSVHNYDEEHFHQGQLEYNSYGHPLYAHNTTMSYYPQEAENNYLNLPGFGQNKTFNDSNGNGYDYQQDYGHFDGHDYLYHKRLDRQAFFNDITSEMEASHQFNCEELNESEEEEEEEGDSEIERQFNEYHRNRIHHLTHQVAPDDEEQFEYFNNNQSNGQENTNVVFSSPQRRYVSIRGIANARPIVNNNDGQIYVDCLETIPEESENETETLHTLSSLESSGDEHSLMNNVVSSNLVHDNVANQLLKQKFNSKEKKIRSSNDKPLNEHQHEQDDDDDSGNGSTTGTSPQPQPQSASSSPNSSNQATPSQTPDSNSSDGDHIPSKACQDHIKFTSQLMHELDEEEEEEIAYEGSSPPIDSRSKLERYFTSDLIDDGKATTVSNQSQNQWLKNNAPIESAKENVDNVDNETKQTSIVHKNHCSLIMIHDDERQPIRMDDNETSSTIVNNNIQTLDLIVGNKNSAETENHVSSLIPIGAANVSAVDILLNNIYKAHKHSKRSETNKKMFEFDSSLVQHLGPESQYDLAKLFQYTIKMLERKESNEDNGKQIKFWFKLMQCFVQKYHLNGWQMNECLIDYLTQFYSFVNHLYLMNEKRQLIQYKAQPMPSLETNQSNEDEAMERPNYTVTVYSSDQNTTNDTNRIKIRIQGNDIMIEDDNNKNGQTMLFKIQNSTPIYRTILQINTVEGKINEDITDVDKTLNRPLLNEQFNKMNDSGEIGAKKFWKLPSILNQNFIRTITKMNETTNEIPTEEKDKKSTLFLEGDEDIYLEFKQRERQLKEKQTKSNGLSSFLGSFTSRSKESMRISKENLKITKSNEPTAKQTLNVLNKRSSKSFNYNQRKGKMKNEDNTVSSWFRFPFTRSNNQTIEKVKNTKTILVNVKDESKSNSEPNLAKNGKRSKEGNNMINNKQDNKQMIEHYKSLDAGTFFRSNKQRMSSNEKLVNAQSDTSLLLYNKVQQQYAHSEIDIKSAMSAGNSTSTMQRNPSMLFRLSNVTSTLERNSQHCSNEMLSMNPSYTMFAKDMFNKNMESTRSLLHLPSKQETIHRNLSIEKLSKKKSSLTEVPREAKKNSIGRVALSIMFDVNNNSLDILAHKAKLKFENKIDCYLKFYIQPYCKMNKRKTKIRKNTNETIFNELIRYKLGSLEEMFSKSKNIIIEVGLWSHYWNGRNRLLGECSLLLAKEDLFKNRLNKIIWYNLSESINSTISSSQPKGNFPITGSIFLALRYQLADANGDDIANARCQLSILIKEIIDLNISMFGQSDILAHCKLILTTSHGKKEAIKGTAVRCTTNASFEQTFNFKNIVPMDLGDSQLAISVWAQDSSMMPAFGKFFLGGINLSIHGKETIFDEERALWGKITSRDTSMWVYSEIPLHRFRF